jgi:ABC-2 type transport system ATP-binding protein
MADTPAIKADGLSKQYKLGRFRKRRLDALKNVSLQVDQGEIFGLLGPNGAGKTTFIKLLLGIVRKSEGEAQLMGEPAGSRAGRRMVGYLPENLRLPKHMTGLTALDYFGRLSNMPSKEIKQRSQELLELVGIADRAKDSVAKYSKGMAQRLGLAQALLHKPRLLILDEPTDGLDPVARSQVRDILMRLKQESGATIFLNSHLLQEVEQVCDRVAILHHGELRSVGSVDEIRQGEAAHEVEFELWGTQAAVESAFPASSILSLSARDGQKLQVVARLKDQTAVDQCIDSLRAAGVSVVGFGQRRASLESAFLDIVGESRQTS